MKTVRILLSISALLLIVNTAKAQDTVSELGYSERNRQDKKFLITGQPIGFGPVGMLTQGVTFGIYLDPNSLITVDLKTGRDSSLINWSWDHYSVKYSAIGVNFKQFVNTSFYVQGGLNLRQIDYTYDYNGWYSGTSTEYTRFKGKTLEATFAIGNQWQWGKFTMGCDWVGINLPVTTTIDSESTTGTSPSTKHLNDDEDKYLKQTSAIVTNFYLGVSF